MERNLRRKCVRAVLFNHASCCEALSEKKSIFNKHIPKLKKAKTSKVFLSRIMSSRENKWKKELPQIIYDKIN